MLQGKWKLESKGRYRANIAKSEALVSMTMRPCCWHGITDPDGSEEKQCSGSVATGPFASESF